MRIALLLALLLTPGSFCLLTRARQTHEPPARASGDSAWTRVAQHPNGASHGTRHEGAVERSKVSNGPLLAARRHKESSRQYLSNHDAGRRLANDLHDYATEGSGPQSQEADVDQSGRPRRAPADRAAAARLARRQTEGGVTQCAAAQASAAILGVRCDECAEVQDGILVVMANEPSELLLIGRNFDANISVALTPESNAAQADCTHADRVRALNFRNVSSSIARIVIDVPAPTNELRPYYLCVRDLSGRWYHQGAEPWLKLYVKENLLSVHMKIILVAVLLMLSGLFSGLNLGLMALDKNELQVIISCGSDTEKRYARAIEPVRRRGNYLLCSILFTNVLVNSTIAVLLEELTSGIVAVMTSTIFIVMFGEILPQAFCSRHGLAVGAKTVSITYFCMIVTFPLSYPVSWCLDWALGEEIGHAYDRERLMEFIRVTRDYNNLETDEVNIIQGALKLKRIPLSEVMTRIEDVFMLDLSAVLDFDTIQAIIERGYSRVPVHEPGNKKNIVALLFAKDLALLDPDDKTPVQTLISFYNHPIMYLFEDETLDLALDEFKTGKSHMAFVRRVLDDGDRDPVYEITGVVTLEDVIEEIMQMEINDETDVLSDNKRKRRRKEAQVRRDFAQFAHFGAGEASFSVVSPQLCLAAYQYLATTVDAFSAKFVSDLILKRLLSQKIYYRARLEDERCERQLYAAGEPADFFVMILEGRVRVVCGKESLTFEGGPFTYFGRAALQAPASDQLDALALEQECGSALELAATRQQVGHGSPRPGDRQQPQQEGARLAKRLSSTAAPSALTLPLKQSQSRASLESMGNSFFVPDYSVEIAADTSYLKIGRQEYLAALRATRLERGSVGGSALELDSPRPRPRGSPSQRPSIVSELATGFAQRRRPSDAGPKRDSDDKS